MKAGQLDQRVTVERLEQTQNEFGEMVQAWATLFTTWAAVEPLAGREWIAAAAAQSEVTTRVRMRFRPGLTSADRVTHEGKVLNIVSVIDYRSAHRELVLMCRG